MSMSFGETRAQHPTGRRRVVGDRVAELDLPVGDPRVDQLDCGGERRRRRQHVVLGAPGAGQIVGENESDFDLDARIEIVRRLDRAVLVDLHLVEQVAVVGFVDVHHLLHGLRRQADLVPDHFRAAVHTLADVDELDLVGVDDIDIGMPVGQRGDRHAGLLGFGELGCQLFTHVVAEHFAKSPRSVDRHSCPAAGQFYNVFYMTGQEYGAFDVVVVGSGAAGMVAALTAAHQGLSTIVVEKAPHYGGSTASRTPPKRRAPTCTRSSAMWFRPRRSTPIWNAARRCCRSS
jgi:hypothetical protein